MDEQKGTAPSTAPRPAETGDPPLPWKAVLPGLLYILALDLATVTGSLSRWGRVFTGWPVVLAVLPWATLLVLRRHPAAFGYRARRAIAEFGWGMLAGAIWRGLSMAWNLAWLGVEPDFGLAALTFVSALVWVPLMEETFFRGYLGRSLAGRFGRWPGVVVQAVLFALHPGHWAQGWPSWLSIFGFGLLAGWLVEFRRSIWPAWGAHGFANVLPDLLRLLR